MAVSFHKPSHDHLHCVEKALSKAEALCRARGARLTPMRRKVLELLWQRHEPFGAYDLLKALGKDDTRVMPPTVYRALEFLQAQGLVHRIEVKNAYVGCAQPDLPHAGQFLICKECGVAAEMQSASVDAAVLDAAEAHDFEVESQTVEITGTCPNCREERA